LLLRAEMGAGQVVAAGKVWAEMARSNRPSRIEGRRWE
jgi:hypothetical protein